MQKIKILIVEDHKVTQKLLDQSLRNDIFEKRIAENGESALEHYHEWKPDVILLDILLPVISGYAILKEIRTKDKDTSTAIIIVSSLMTKEDVMDCAKLGIEGYIVKPINVKQMNRKVLEYLSKSSSEKATEATKLFKLLE
jgi:DNA-binding response OmpR family regulator